MALLDITDSPAGVAVAGPLSGAWQVPKFGDAGQPEPAELFLLTPARDLWLNRVSDGGKSLPNNPLQAQAQLCQTTVSPRLGWALGAGAAPISIGLFLPPDPVSADSLQSRVEGTLQSNTSAFSQPLSAATALRLPPPAGFAPPSIIALDPQAKLERTFSAYLLPGQIAAPPGFFATNLPQPQLARSELITGFTITLDDALLQGRLWLVTDTSLWPPGIVVLAVSDDQRGTWKLNAQTNLAPGLTAVQYVPTAPANGVRVVKVSWIAGLTVGYLGLGGITVTAQKAADARNAANAAAAAALATAAATPPAKPADPPSAVQRSVLQPGRLYRLDIAMSWTGTLYQRGDSGKTPLATLADQTAYAPKDPAASTSTNRSYFFRTTPVPVVPPNAPAYGSVQLVRYLYKQTDLFDPTMIQRYLLGYEPAQSELDRFCNDPLSVHFSVAHAAVLADRYGYKLQLGLRRTDAAGPDGEKVALDGVFTQLLAPKFAKGTDAIRIEIASAAPCKVPTPGSTMRAPATLAPQAWYEVYALASSKAPAIADGTLPGVSFRTSRWATPQAMLEALHFSAAGRGSADGDLEISPDAVLTPRAVDDQDAAFDAFLAQCGLEGWPIATVPRVSLLWKRDSASATPAWHFVGVIIESPEAIHRAGRFLIGDLTLTMGLFPPAVTFDIRRRDRAGSRILLATSKPFTPSGWRDLPLPPRPFPNPFPRSPVQFHFPFLTLHAVDLGPSGTPGPGVPVTGVLALPTAPAFAVEEVS